MESAINHHTFPNLNTACIYCIFSYSSGRTVGHTPTVNISGLKSDGLGTLRGGVGPGVPASEGEEFVSWVTFPFFVSGLLASRRKPHLCWLQEFSLLKKGVNYNLIYRGSALVNTQITLFLFYFFLLIFCHLTNRLIYSV